MTSVPPRRATLAVVSAILAALLLGVVALSSSATLRWSLVRRAAAFALDRNAVRATDLDPVRAAGPTIYLVVGSDRRDGLPAGSADYGHLSGERADSITLWALDGRRVSVLALPRDLRVHVPRFGTGKLGGALDYGPRELVAAVRALTGLPVHHYVELDFAAVVSVVDRLGGIDLAVPWPARDRFSGLELRAGSQHLDGAAALAYARSRTYEELRGVHWTAVDQGDLGRIGRQRRLLASLLAALPRRCTPLNCVDLVRRLGDSLTVDRTFGGRAVDQLTTALLATGSTLWAAVLPTRTLQPTGAAMSPFPPLHLGAVGYRILLEPAATALLRRFDPARTSPPRGGKVAS